MVDRVDIMRRVDGGRGKAAKKLGSPYDVYRVELGSSGDFVSAPHKVASDVLVLAKPSSLAAHKDGVVANGLVEYNLIADLSSFKVGDVFVNVDQFFGTGHTRSVSAPAGSYQGFCLTQHASIRKAIGCRLNDTAQVYRLNKGVDADGYWSAEFSNSNSLRLVSGVFSFGAGVAAKIPIQLAPVLRPYGDRVIDKEPSNIRQSAYMAFVPPLPGFHFREGDRLIASDGARYVVVVPGGQDVGAVGFQMFLQREVAQPDGQ